MTKQEENKKNFDTLGQRFRHCRETTKCTQAEFAAQLGFSTSGVVSRFERDERLPSAETLIKLAELYETDLHWLLTGQPCPALKNVVLQLQPFISGILADISQQIKAAQIHLVELQIGQNVMGQDNKTKLKQARAQLNSLKERYEAVLQCVQETGFLNLDL